MCAAQIALTTTIGEQLTSQRCPRDPINCPKLVHMMRMKPSTATAASTSASTTEQPRRRRVWRLKHCKKHGQTFHRDDAGAENILTVARHQMEHASRHPAFVIKQRPLQQQQQQQQSAKRRRTD